MGYTSIGALSLLTPYRPRHDVWPQLPAQMFWHMYSTYPDWNGAIFGAGKKCAPQPSSDELCDAMPESRLPRDVYGPSTDIIQYHLPVYDYADASEHLHDDPNHPELFAWGRYERVRPRFGNSGSMFFASV